MTSFAGQSDLRIKPALGAHTEKSPDYPKSARLSSPLFRTATCFLLPGVASCIDSEPGFLTLLRQALRSVWTQFCQNGFTQSCLYALIICT